MENILQQTNTQELSKEEKKKAYMKEWIAKNQEHVRQYHKDYIANYITNNKERLRQYHKERYIKNKEKYSKHSQKWYQNNKEKLSSKYWTPEERMVKSKLHQARRNKKYKEDAFFAFKCRLRGAVGDAFKRIRQNKYTNTEKLLGCTWLEAKEYFEKLFLPGMSWENRHMWHIDHIRPVCSFTEKDMHLMNHISNLRPLWAEDNLSKSGADKSYKFTPQELLSTCQKTAQK